MMYKRIFIGAVVLAGLTCLFSFVRFADDPITIIAQQLQKWTNEQPIEKVYVQFDKPYYAAGDDIWFKAYVVNGNNHQLSNISGIVNVELIDQRDSITRSDKLALTDGTANGDFALPDTLHPGNYRIRAYTNYMRNAGSNYFFDKAITIINNINPGKAPKLPNQPASTGKIDVQFFPESGYLVNGIESDVAFKAIAPNGLGVDIKGTITDSKGQQVAQFASTHLGMGKFDLEPKPGEVYKAAITNQDGSTQIIELPKAMDNGYNLHVSENTQNLSITIQNTRSLVTNDPSKQPVLVAQSGGKISYSGVVPTTAQTLRMTISKTAFASGIAQFTLFSSTGEPLNERLIFIHNPADQLNLSLSTYKEVYSPRQKVKLTLDALNSKQAPIAGNFSVAVTDESKVPVNEDTENNILANLLLTSDLRGYIEQPAWYFNHPNAQTDAALDVLMLTQGYHRFEWKELLKSAYPSKAYQPENSLQVSGSIVTPGGTRPIANAKVTLYDLDSIMFTREAITDAYGRFAFKNLSFNDSVRFIVQARTDKNKRNVDIKLDKIIPANTSASNIRNDFQLNAAAYLSVYAQSSKQLYVEERPYGLGNHVSSLQEVVIREKKEALKYSANLNGAGNADQLILGKTLRDMGCQNLADCLAGRLVGVTFRGGVAYSTRSFNRPMQLVIDGAYSPFERLNSINYNDVQSLEILRSGGLISVYGSNGANGVIVVTTKRGGDNDDDIPEPIYGRGIITYFPKGYYLAREFYSPRYDKPETNKKLADLRTTIYWNPKLITSATGKTSFEYFNAGSKGNYRVVVEGIGNDGSIGRQVFRYKVE